MKLRSAILIIHLGTVALLTSCGADKPPQTEPAGRDTTVKTDTLQGKFPQPTKEIPGVVDAGAGAPQP